MKRLLNDVMKRLLNDVCRCHDAGCPKAKRCLRYLRRNDEGKGMMGLPSMFPYDIPLSDPCPHFIEGETKDKNEK